MVILHHARFDVLLLAAPLLKRLKYRYSPELLLAPTYSTTRHKIQDWPSPLTGDYASPAQGLSQELLVLHQASMPGTLVLQLSTPQYGHTSALAILQEMISQTDRVRSPDRIGPSYLRNQRQKRLIIVVLCAGGNPGVPIMHCCLRQSSANPVSDSACLTTLPARTPLSHRQQPVYLFPTHVLSKVTLGICPNMV